MNSPARRTYPALGVVWIAWWSLWSAIFVIIVLVEIAGSRPSASGILGGLVGAVLTAVLAGARVVAGRHAVRSAKPAPALPAAAPRLPGNKSAAWAPMRRLVGAETALRDLLRQLGDAAVSRDVVDAAWRTANETASRLRVLAAKIEAVEAAIAHAAAGQRAGLEDGVRNLLAHIDRGVDGYQELVAAAGHLVLADSANPVPDGLVEAIDHLAGLASALRETSIPALIERDFQNRP